MELTNNALINYLLKIVNNFYKFNYTQPTNPANKYIEYYKTKNKFDKFKKFPLVYKNPRWDFEQKKLVYIDIK
jgi:hypothetical protein